MKITIIGAGSTYTPELVEGFIKNNYLLHISTLCLMDIDIPKSSIIRDFAQRMVRHSGQSFLVELTNDLDSALSGADFVLTQIRVGKLPARVLDEKIPLKYNLLGQETTGIGGFFKALRTIPVLYDIAGRMQRLCPDAWLINFANPSGIIAEMLLNYTPVKAIGLCNVPYHMSLSVRELLGLPEAEVDYVGLNHLSWITSIRHNGKEYIDEAIEKEFTAGRMSNITKADFDYDIVKTVRAIPSSYLEYFYFSRSKQKKLMEEELTRGEVCMALEKELLELYQQETLVEKPEALTKRGGSYYSEAAVNLICAIYGDKNETHVVDIRNNGAIPFMAADDVVELPAVVNRQGITPKKVANCDNPHIRALMTSVKAYEKLTVQAALKGDDRIALQALSCHPLLGDFPSAKACYFELKEAHRQHLPGFFKK